MTPLQLPVKQEVPLGGLLVTFLHQFHRLSPLCRTQKFPYRNGYKFAPRPGHARLHRAIQFSHLPLWQCYGSLNGIRTILPHGSLLRYLYGYLTIIWRGVKVQASFRVIGILALFFLLRVSRAKSPAPGWKREGSYRHSGQWRDRRGLFEGEMEKSKSARKPVGMFERECGV